MNTKQPFKRMTDRGFLFASEKEAKLDIYTRHNRDGTTIKQISLTGCGRVARVRQSNAKDCNEARKITSNSRQYGIVMLSLCTMLGDKRAALSDIEKMSEPDLRRLLIAYIHLNVKDWQAFVDNNAAEVIMNIAMM